MIEQNNFTQFGNQMPPLLGNQSGRDVDVTSETNTAYTVHNTTPPAGTNPTQTNPPFANGAANFATNYAMAQQMGSAPQPGFGNGPEYGYRSTYLHSHAKPPYSYISLIAMSIQVIIFNFKNSLINFKLRHPHVKCVH